ncbi:fructosamine kinase family protein [Companilactobacillus mishanensis]|uniref:Fructosamine kinase family protein n=1 Tax=Companilactobacillus mishanensis TaxID=2486008 RepID=A0A5P0ZIG1_9LACO|nr:fructosamine kinase family protein [Companilactobacillus mishanensis]MQS52859.1 fructosamine kinase family protein [Companilactobacillus mishanensis]
MRLNKAWFQELGIDNVKDFAPVSGGDINLAFKISTNDENYFLKVQPKNDETFFDHEIEGLNLINEVANAPKPIKSGNFERNGYLLMNYLEFGEGSQKDLGKMVAKMHEKHAPQFGLDHNIENAKNPKINTWQDNWSDFYINQRLNVLIEQIKKHGDWTVYRQSLMNRFQTKIREYYADHKVEPSLMHGDLWNGNVGFQADGTPILFDPDVFYGNREMDIAMTVLFGGFSQDFYDGYNEEYPLDKGWELRVPWYQTYYLLAHVNLFGENYGTSLESALQQSVDL